MCFYIYHLDYQDQQLFYVIIIFSIGVIIFLNDEDNYISLDNPNLIETENGYKEVIEWENKITDKRHSAGGPGATYEYVIYVYNDELKESVRCRVGNLKYEEFEVNEKVKVITTIYYNKKGLRLDVVHEIEKLESGEVNE